MDKVKSRKEMIQSHVKTNDEELIRKKSYGDIVIHNNEKLNGVRTESIHVHTIKMTTSVQIYIVLIMT